MVGGKGKEKEWERKGLRRKVTEKGEGSKGKNGEHYERQSVSLSSTGWDGSQTNLNFSTKRKPCTLAYVMEQRANGTSNMDSWVDIVH